MGRDVGVGQLVEELEQRGDRLPFEIGAFVALEACEGLLQESVKLDADDVRVTAEGSVVVSGGAPRVDPDEAARSLVSVLARLLVAAGPGVPPDLLQLVKDTKTGENPRDLRHLHDAIEASLIPINRGASRRVLARLVRESDRPPAPDAARVDPRELDTELEELLRDPATRTLEPAHAALPLEPPLAQEPITERIRIPGALIRDPDVDVQPETLPVPPSRPAVARSATPLPDLKPLSEPRTAAAAAVMSEQPPQPGPEPITATIRKWSSEDGAIESAAAPMSKTASVSVLLSEAVTETGRVAGAGSVTESANPAETRHVAAPALETPTESVFGTGSVNHAESVPASLPLRESAAAPEPTYDRASRPVSRPPRRRGGLGVLLAAAVLGIGLYALISTGTLDALLRPAAPVATPVTSGVIEVTVTPSDAQIFVFVGRGPATAPGLAIDSAHEFIVLDRGLRPSRGIVPRGASWTKTEDGLLYELAIQADAAADASDAVDFGSAETEPTNADIGETGTVRVITNPLAVKVYRYVGAGPSVQIPAASIHEGQEVLVYHPEHETRRAVIGPSDWQAREGQAVQSAILEVQLPALPQSEAPETLED